MDVKWTRLGIFNPPTESNRPFKRHSQDGGEIFSEVGPTLRLKGLKRKVLFLDRTMDRFLLMNFEILQVERRRKTMKEMCIFFPPLIICVCS